MKIYLLVSPHIHYGLLLFFSLRHCNLKKLKVTQRSFQKHTLCAIYGFEQGCLRHHCRLKSNFSQNRFQLRVFSFFYPFDNYQMRLQVFRRRFCIVQEHMLCPYFQTWINLLKEPIVVEFNAELSQHRYLDEGECVQAVFFFSK